MIDTSNEQLTLNQNVSQAKNAKVYILKGLDCPNCAAKIEKEVAQLDGITGATVNLIKQTILVEGENATNLLKVIKKIVHNHEPQVVVLEETTAKTKEQDGDNKQKLMLIRIIVGAVIYGAGLILDNLVDIPPLSLGVMIAAYVILGGDVVLRAVKNIIKGRVFDENFLMSLSTVGAFVIGENPEAVAVMLFYQVGEFFQNAAVSRSRKSIVGLMDLRPDVATVIRGSEQVVSPEEVGIGELIVVKPGEKIPLDGVVVSGESRLDTMALTGESAPRSIAKGEDALSGCVNLSGVLTIKVTKEAKDSTVSKIIDLVENAASKKAPAENFITSFARYYTPAVVIIAVLLAVIPPLFFDGVWTEWINRGLVFLVVSCPCALVISIPLTFFGGIGASSRRGVLVKGSNYLDALSGVSTIVFDKTGTLTKGVFNVTEIMPAIGTKEELLLIAAKAECYSTHPIARSIMAAYGKEIDRNGVSDYTEISGHGVSAVVGGSRILAGNIKLMEQNGITFPPCDKVGTKVYVAQNNVYAGCILISDELKPDSKDTIAQLKSLGVEKTVMLTGDDENIAKAVAAGLNIDEYYAQLLPAQKVERLEQLSASSQGKKLVFVGDGINDAPVLARADVGVAMGGLGSDAAIEAADVVLMTDEPKKLVEVIKVARATRRIVVQNIVFALAVKAVILVLGAFGIAGMWEAVFGDVGVAVIAILNALRILKKK